MFVICSSEVSRVELYKTGLSMLLRPLLETSSACATQLRPRSSLFKRSLLKKQNNRAHSSLHDVLNNLGVHSPPRPSNRFKARQEDRRDDSRPSEQPRYGKLLIPYDLSQRVEALCRDGNLSKAISIVKEAPLDAQNTIVWGSLIRSVILAGRYQEAYRLFIDVNQLGMPQDVANFSGS